MLSLLQEKFLRVIENIVRRVPCEKIPFYENIVEVSVRFNSELFKYIDIQCFLRTTSCLFKQDKNDSLLLNNFALADGHVFKVVGPNICRILDQHK
jgi:hypothetical protein